MISRKPVPGASAPSMNQKAPNQPRVPQDDPPAYDTLAQEDPIEEGVPQPDLEEQLEHLDLETEQLPHGPVLADESIVSGSQNPSSTSSAEKPSKWKSALGVAYNEAKHFAGGLITHPYEATKHYSILRHSHGLVFYQGPSTSVAITIFSSQPLPADRTLWLQKRGFSGSAGLRLGASALGSRSAWINVTPAQSATPAQLRPADERAWQRDISRFLRKASSSSSSSSSSAAARHLAAQRARETDIVRIPHVAEDGYFRLVLCAGDRKVLCPSPVFRYASTSADPGRVRGASLKTVPLELGIKLGAFVANQLGTTAAGNALAPVQNAVQPYELGGLTQAAAQGAYTATGAEERVNAQLEVAGEKYDEKVAGEREVLAGGDVRREVLEKQDGPVSPYPVRFSGSAGAAVREGFGARAAGVPTVSLASVPDDIARRLSGVYLAWAAVQKPKSAKAAAMQPQMYDSWIPALVVVTVDLGGRADVVERRLVSVSLIQELDERTLVDCKLNVMVMAFLRPLLDRSEAKDGIAQFTTDVATARDVLSRPAWAAEDVLERTKSQASAKSLPERVANLREVGQKQVDRMQLHRYGLRMDSMEARDQMVGVGGICVKR